MEPWQVGTDLAYLRQLTAYWRDGFDWRAQEVRLNRFPQFRVPLAGIDLHYLHVPGTGPRPLPLLLLHGWPGSVWEFHKIIPLLTDPARFGARSGGRVHGRRAVAARLRLLVPPGPAALRRTPDRGCAWSS